MATMTLARFFGSSVKPTRRSFWRVIGALMLFKEHIQSLVQKHLIVWWCRAAWFQIYFYFGEHLCLVLRGRLVIFHLLATWRTCFCINGRVHCSITSGSQSHHILTSHVRIQRVDRGSGPALENHKLYGFFIEIIIWTPPPLKKVAPTPWKMLDTLWNLGKL